MSDPYAETDEWPTPSLSARPATHSPERPVDGSTVTGDAEGAREARYAEAMYGRAILPNRHTDERVRAVMAVADEEQATLRAEVANLRMRFVVAPSAEEPAEDGA